MGLSDKLTERVADLLVEAQQQMAEVAAGLAQFQNGNRLTGARPVSVGGHPRLWGGSGRVVGWSFYASGPVTAVLRDSRVGGDGDVLAAFNLTDGEDAGQWMGPGGVSFGEGLYLEKTAGAGSLVGTIYLGAVD